MPAKSDTAEHRGDPMTVEPRLQCGDCGEWVYVSSPRHTAPTHLYFECECKVVSQRQLEDSFPEVWERAF